MTKEMPTINAIKLRHIIDMAPLEHDDDKVPFNGDVKEKILKRDEYQCVVCPENRKSKLRVHHIDPQGSADEANLITVCDVCHEYIHKQLRKKGYKYFRPR